MLNEGRPLGEIFDLSGVLIEDDNAEDGKSVGDRIAAGEGEASTEQALLLHNGGAPPTVDGFVRFFK